MMNVSILYSFHNCPLRITEDFLCSIVSNAFNLTNTSCMIIKMRNSLQYLRFYIVRCAFAKFRNLPQPYRNEENKRNTILKDMIAFKIYIPICWFKMVYYILMKVFDERLISIPTRMCIRTVLWMLQNLKVNYLYHIHAHVYAPNVIGYVNDNPFFNLVPFHQSLCIHKSLFVFFI